jgi:TonB family protein
LNALRLPHGWENWPGWPWVLSLWLHLLLLISPVALISGKGLVGGSPLRLEARLETRPVSAANEARIAQAPLPAAAPVSGQGVPDATPPQSPSALRVRGRYFSSAEVDQKAEPIAVAPLIYPEEAHMRQLPGRVVLRVYIDETGAIDGVDILESDPPGLFDQAAVDAVLATRFRPAMRLARPVKNVKRVEIRFDPADSR